MVGRGGVEGRSYSQGCLEAQELGEAGRTLGGAWRGAQPWSPGPGLLASEREGRLPLICTLLGGYFATAASRQPYGGQENSR